MANNLRILIVEDLPSDVRFIKEILKDIPETRFKIFEADTLKKALKLINKNIDMILLDLNLPDSNGLSTFEIIKKSIANIP
jgi:DNA-binding response OmpR family regulator